MRYLLKPGELVLKHGNRWIFENKLRENLKKLLKGTGARLVTTEGRWFVDLEDGTQATRAEGVFSRLFGISGWALTRVCEKALGAVLQECVQEARDFVAAQAVRSFRIEARRADKSFPLDSFGIMAAAGQAVLDALPGLKVDLHKPELVINIEIREKAYVYSNAKRGLRGLPVASAGRGLLLLSGGIDSPVAGFLMAGRGLAIEAVHFHAYPYTSEEAKQKVLKLAEILGAYTMGVPVHIIGFTQVQLRIKEAGPVEWATVLLRMAMMKAGEALARSICASCLITGESLSQVASQTPENLACAESLVKIPVLRPLIGTAKEDIIILAEKIGTYKTSILPYEDCCVLFSPKHPILHGQPDEAARLYKELELDELIESALRSHELYD